jgi:hypothetical protein
MPSWVKVYWLRLSYPVWLKTRSTMTWGVLIYPAKCVGEGWPQELVVERERVWWGLSEKFKHWGAPVVKRCAGKKPHLLWWEDHPVTKGLQRKLTIKYVVGIVLGSKTCSLAMCIGCQVGPRTPNLRLLNPVISTAFFPQTLREWRIPGKGVRVMNPTFTSWTPAYVFYQLGLKALTPDLHSLLHTHKEVICSRSLQVMWEVGLGLSIPCHCRTWHSFCSSHSLIHLGVTFTLDASTPEQTGALWSKWESIQPAACKFPWGQQWLPVYKKGNF